MQTLIEFVPLLAFLIAYQLGGIYIATSTLMSAMMLLLLWDWVKSRKIPAMHAISAALVLVFGSATLVLHDQRFIIWKPTVFFWVTGLAFLGSQFLTQKTLAERLLSGANPEIFRAVSASKWRQLNLIWVLFYSCMGTLNIWVARHFSEAIWVNFKVFGITALTMIFVLVQMFWLLRSRSITT